MATVNRDALRSVVLALLAVLAVALVSATVTDVSEPTTGSGEGAGGGSGGGGGGGLVPDESASGAPLGVDDTTRAGGEICVAALDEPWVQLLLAGALVVLFAAVWYRTNVVASAVLVGVVALPLALLYVTLSCSDGDGMPEPPNQAAAGAGSAPETGAGSSGGGGVPETVFSAPLWVVVLVGGIAVAVTLITLTRSGGVRELVASTDETTGDESNGATDVVAVGRVAGRAADRIETGVDADNEVFRAWTAMTEHLDVDRPESSTPQEFADAAVSAGFDRADVTELTDLFAAVRYGGEDPTDDRERRAVAALRRIEAASEPTDDDGGDG